MYIVKDVLLLINNPLMIILISVLWGVTEKIADLTDEHGLKLFKGANITFGVLWGFFLALLAINQNVVVSSLAIAMLMSYILRYRIDYLNHGIAAIIVLFAFFEKGAIIDWGALLFFFTVFGLGGLIHGSLAEKPGIKKFMGKWLTSFFEYRVYIYLFPLFFSVYTGEWLAFLVASSHMLAYEAVRQHYNEIKEPIHPKS